MNYLHTIIFIFVLTTVSYYIDRYRYCKNGTFKSSILLFIHHLLNIFANFGWATTSIPVLYFYLCAPVITALHWATNNGKCFLTQEYNRICGLPDDLPFNDMFNIIGLKRYNWWNNIGHYIYLGLALALALYKVSR